MIMVGRIDWQGYQHESDSGAKWTMGKGLLGQAVFSGEPKSLVHSLEWDAGIGDLHPKDFLAQPRSIRRGHEQSDFKNLRATYGSAVAAPLRLGDKPAFGCVTAHTPAGRSLTDNEIEVCVDNMVVAAEHDLPLCIRSELRYPVDEPPLENFPT